MKFYFAYGSNMWLGQMKRRCPNYRVIGNGVLKGYRWIINKRGFANVIKSEQDEVHGVIYEISATDEQSLDCQVGVHNNKYRKQMMTVDFAGQNQECLVYVDPIFEEGKPKQEYIERLKKGIIDTNLTCEYVSRYLREYIDA